MAELDQPGRAAREWVGKQESGALLRIVVLGKHAIPLPAFGQAEGASPGIKADVYLAALGGKRGTYHCRGIAAVWQGRAGIGWPLQGAEANFRAICRQ